MSVWFAIHLAARNDELLSRQIPDAVSKPRIATRPTWIQLAGMCLVTAFFTFAITTSLSTKQLEEPADSADAPSRAIEGDAFDRFAQRAGKNLSNTIAKNKSLYMARARLIEQERERNGTDAADSGTGDDH